MFLASIPSVGNKDFNENVRAAKKTAADAFFSRRLPVKVDGSV